MMKKLVLVLSLLPTLAFAQQPPTEVQILSTTIGQLFAENARLAVELQKAQATIAALQKEKAEVPKPPATTGSSAK
jgi:hypothetical protein